MSIPAAPQPLDPKSTQGLKHFSTLKDLLARLHEVGTARDSAGNRHLGSSGILGEDRDLTVSMRDLRFIPKGCQTVAGGRSAAETPGKIGTMPCIPQGCQNASIHCGHHSIATGIPSGCDCHSAPFRWSPRCCDHRLLSAIPSG